jgi:hypothetical protein
MYEFVLSRKCENEAVNVTKKERSLKKENFGACKKPGGGVEPPLPV